MRGVNYFTPAAQPLDLRGARNRERLRGRSVQQPGDEVARRPAHAGEAAPQQNPASFSIAEVGLKAASIRLVHTRPLMFKVLALLSSLKASQVVPVTP
jgi:hypothetical protein